MSSVVASTNASAPGMPTTRAMEDTVRGSSPEMTLSVTPCSRKYPMVSAAEGRISSRIVTKPIGRASPTMSPSSVNPSTRATTSTRQLDARRLTLASKSWKSSRPSTNWAAPITYEASPSAHASTAPLHFFADENAIARTAEGTCGASAKWCSRAVHVSLASAVVARAMPDSARSSSSASSRR